MSTPDDYPDYDPNHAIEMPASPASTCHEALLQLAELKISDSPNVVLAAFKRLQQDAQVRIVTLLLPQLQPHILAETENKTRKILERYGVLAIQECDSAMETVQKILLAMKAGSTLGQLAHMKEVNALQHMGRSFHCKAADDAYSCIVFPQRGKDEFDVGKLLQQVIVALEIRKFSFEDQLRSFTTMEVDELGSMETFSAPASEPQDTTFEMEIIPPNEE